MQKVQRKKGRLLKWMKDWMSNFRLSLSFRVSLNYLRFFLINGILFFAMAGLLYLREELKPFYNTAEQMTVLFEMGGRSFQQYIQANAPENYVWS